MSISVIGEEQLEQLHATQLTDYAGYMPGFIVSDGGAPGQAILALRGIPPVSAGSTVATYIDETPLGTSPTTAPARRSSSTCFRTISRASKCCAARRARCTARPRWAASCATRRSQPDTRTYVAARFGADVSSISGGGDMGFGARGAFNAPISPGKLALSVSARASGHAGLHRQRAHRREGSELVRRRSRPRGPVVDADRRTCRSKCRRSTQRTDADSASYVALDPVTHKPIYG